MTLSLPASIEISNRHLLYAYLVVHLLYAFISHFQFMRKVKQLKKDKAEIGFSHRWQLNLERVFAVFFGRIVIGLEFRMLEIAWWLLRPIVIFPVNGLVHLINAIVFCGAELDTYESTRGPFPLGGLNRVESVFSDPRPYY